MRVLVTGATGFLGKQLTLRLHQLGWDVLATGRNLTEGERFKDQGISFAYADLENENTIVSLCKGREIIFHCGAFSSPWGPYETFYQSNVLGTKHVIRGCQKHGVGRLVYVSTPSIYFNYRNRLLISEQDPLPLKKVNAYATTKWIAEQEIDLAYQEGLSVVTIRPRALFGPGDRTILPRLLQANKAGALPLIKNGKVLLDVTYVENVVDALLLCATSGVHTLGKKYNITNDDPVYIGDFLNQLLDRLEEPKHFKSMSYITAYTVATLMEFAAVISKKEPVLTRYTVGLLGKNQTLDIGAAKNELNYVPRVNIAEGIERFATWWEGEKLCRR